MKGSDIPCEHQSPFDEATLNKIFKEEVVSICINKEHDLSCSLYEKDYLSLLGHNWLRTQAIDILLKLLCESALQEIGKVYASRGAIAEEQHRLYVKLVDAFIVTLLMTNDDQAVLESLAPLQLFSPQTKYLIIPINSEYSHGQHWMLALFQNGNYRSRNQPSTLHLFDSGAAGGGAAHRLAAKLQQLYRVLTKEEMSVGVASSEQVPQQSNGYDCGVYTIGFGEYVLKEIIQELQDDQPALQLNRLNKQYKYILGNSAMARQRYRRMLEQRMLAA